jgi:hypothetical protein
MISGALPEGAAFTYNTPTPVGNMVKTTPQPWMQNSPFIQQSAQQSAPAGLPSINYPQQTSVPQVAPVVEQALVTNDFADGYVPATSISEPIQETVPQNVPEVQQSTAPFTPSTPVESAPVAPAVSTPLSTPKGFKPAYNDDISPDSRRILSQMYRVPEYNSGTEASPMNFVYDYGKMYAVTYDPKTNKPTYFQVENPNPADFQEVYSTYDPLNRKDVYTKEDVSKFPTNGVAGTKYIYKPKTPKQMYGGLAKYERAGTLTHTDNPNIDYKELYSFSTPGDELGTRMANNALTGLGVANQAFGQSKQQSDYEKMLRRTGNTDFAYQVTDPNNPFGNYTPNAGPASNFGLVANTPIQDFGTHTIAAKYGGSMKKSSKSYREGGTYVLSPDEVREILRNGGEIEYLD